MWGLWDCEVMGVGWFLGEDIWLVCLFIRLREIDFFLIYVGGVGWFGGVFVSLVGVLEM